MNHKVLLAEDSLTIQKVIKITLTNQSFDIVDCISDDDLFRLLPEVQPELVLLDFNLSDKYTGYELTTKIKAIVPSARVIFLLSTFDNVDEASMEKCGASEKIVKPFDSNKFISICKRLIESAPLEEIKYPEIKQPIQEKPKSHDQWEMNHPVELRSSKKVQMEPTSPFDATEILGQLNKLDQEVTNWGMSIPNVIDGHNTHDKVIDLPPVISQVAVEAPKVINPTKPITAASVSSPEIKFPDNSDLDYPTIEELTTTSNLSLVQEGKSTTSKLVPIEQLNQLPEVEFEIEHSINQVIETDISSLEAQIRDEVQDNLWNVDEFEDLKKDVSKKMEEVKLGFQPSSKDFDESLFRPIDENEEILWASSSEQVSHQANVDQSLKSPSEGSHELIMNELRLEMEELIKKHVKDYMDKMFKEKVEKISWEVIPDLAENLIRQEMSKISNKILNESN
jgi:DNA-binding response OmpR family regulator